MLSLSVLTTDNAECKFAWSLTHVFHCTFAIIQVNLTSCTLTALYLLWYLSSSARPKSKPLMGAEKVLPNQLLMEFLCLSLLPYNLDIILTNIIKSPWTNCHAPGHVMWFALKEFFDQIQAIFLEFTANISQKHFLLPGSEPYFYIFIACS